MTLGESGVIAGVEQAEADSNLQYGISLLHPFLVKLILSNPITKKKMGDKKTDFSQSLQLIIDDWSSFYPTGSKFASFQTYFSRAKQVRHWVAHQSFDRNRYQHCMECLANVATAIGKPDLNKIILNLVVVQNDAKEKQEESLTKEEKDQVNISSLKKEWEALKQEGNQLYKQERWGEAMNCYTRAIHLNQEEAVLYSNRALCEVRLSKFDLAREDIEDAIQLDPKNVKYFRVLSDVLLQMKMHKESLAVCLQGLQINPRDEVLIIRERDCRALIVADTIWYPEFDKSKVGVPLGEKAINRIKNLQLTSEDIEDCHSLDEAMKQNQISTSIAQALQLEHERGPSSEEKACAIYKAVAKKGNPQGLFMMAKFYSEGKAGLPRDFHKAVELCRQAASKKAFVRFRDQIMPNVGVAESENFLGDCYRDGRGVDPCSTKAFEWYLIAAQHDCPTGQNNLGVALLNGDGCKKNLTSARSWFQKAAEQGLAAAQYNFGMMLEEGLGGPIDVKKAAELLKLCADQGYPGALKRLQKLSMSGAIGGSNMQQTKENLKKETGIKGEPERLFLLGQNYRNGTGGFEKDLIQAERNLAASSKAGYKEAHLQLGKLLLELKRNKEAFEIIKLSAEEGSPEGQYELGRLFAFGHGCARDETKARRWLNRAKQQGLTLLQDGKEKAEQDWLEKAIEFGKETSKYESEHQLKSEGMSIDDRQKRWIKSMLDENNPSTPALLEFLDSLPPPGVPRNPYLKLDVMSQGRNRDCLKEMAIRAQNGSITAQSFYKACESVLKAKDHLKRKQTTEAFKLVRLSLREWDYPIVEYSEFYPDCVEAAKEALDRNSEDADALYVLARFGATHSNEEKLRMAKRCVELDPSVPDYHHLLGCMWGFNGNHRNGLRALDRAMELLPNHPDWLYTRAGCLRVRDEKEKKAKNNIYSDEAIETFLKFIELNPTDHRMFPDACYSMAMIYALMDDKTKAEMYYQKGLDAEDPQVRLPCFGPVTGESKMAIRMLLKSWEGFGKPTGSATQKKSTNSCAHCFKANQSFRCTACKNVWYCDRACQVAHWKRHKVDCKRANRL